MVSINAFDNTSCTLPNGALTAFVNGSSSGYTFEWYQGHDISGPLLSVAPTTQHLSAGVYTVAVTDNNSGCKSIVNAIIQDATVYPDVSVMVVSPNTSCTLSPNGELMAIVNGPLSDYTFQWFEGPFIFSGPLLSVTSVVDQLASGIYTVLVSNKYSGCESFANGHVPDACDSVSNVTNSLAAGTEKSAISYYPNPTNGTLWIQSESTEGYVVIMDRMGRVVRKQSSAVSHAPVSLDLSDQPSGQYILKFTSGQGSSQYHIIKE
jgi:hypothetical protein